MSAVIIRFPNQVTVEYFERVERFRSQPAGPLPAALLTAGLWAALYGLLGRR